MRKIALEEHVLDPAAVRRTLADSDELARMSAGGGVMPGYYEPVLHRLADFDHQRLSVMDEHDIDLAVLSLTAPGVQHLTDPDTAVAAARNSNEFLAEQVARHPDRYAGFAAVALQHPDAAADELRRSVTELGFVGAMVNGYTNVHDQDHATYYDDPAFDVFWQAAVDLGSPVYLHPRPRYPPPGRHSTATLNSSAPRGDSAPRPPRTPSA